MTGTTIAQAIPIAISPILTRLYTPEDFGVFALFLAITGVFSVVASGRYELALMLPRKEEDAINIFALGLVILFILSLLLLLFIVILHPYIVNMVNNNLIGYWLYFVPVAFLFIGLFNLLSYYNNRIKHYSDIANATIVKSVVLAVLQVGIGLFKAGPGGLISGQIISSLFANMRLLKNIIKNKMLLSKISKIKMITLAKQYKDFPKYQAPHAMLNTFSAQLPVYLFTPFFGLHVVGLYALSTRIVFAPMMILSGASAKVYNQKVTQLYHEKGDAYGFTVRLLKSFVKKIIIPFSIIVIFAPNIFGFIFGEEWREAGVYTQILSPWLFLNVIVSVIAFIPSLTNMQKKALWVSFVYTLVISVAIFMGMHYNSLYLSLTLYSLFASCILLYNLRWMLNKLKGTP